MGQNEQQPSMSLPRAKRKKRSGDAEEREADDANRDDSRFHSQRGSNGQFLPRSTGEAPRKLPAFIPDNAPARHGNRAGGERPRPAMLPAPGRVGSMPKPGSEDEDDDVRNVYLEYERPCRFYWKLLRRRETRPLFLQRNLSYKIRAKREALRQQREEQPSGRARDVTQGPGADGQEANACRIRVTISGLRARTRHGNDTPGQPRAAAGASYQDGAATWPDHVTLFTAVLHGAESGVRAGPAAKAIHDAALFQIPVKSQAHAAGAAGPSPGAVAGLAAAAVERIGAGDGWQQASCVGEFYVEMGARELLDGVAEIAFYVWEDHLSYALLDLAHGRKTPSPKCPAHKPASTSPVGSSQTSANPAGSSSHSHDEGSGQPRDNGSSRTVGGGCGGGCRGQQLLSRAALGGGIIPPGAPVLFAQIPLGSLQDGKSLAPATKTGERGRMATKVVLRRGTLEEVPCPSSPEAQAGKCPGRGSAAYAFPSAALAIAPVSARGSTGQHPRGGGREATALRFVLAHADVGAEGEEVEDLQLEFDATCTLERVLATSCICPVRAHPSETPSEDDSKVMFYFWYQRGERTWAQATHNFSCPFCGRTSYGSFMGLVSHLVACHDRFDLRIQEQGDGMQQDRHVIEVAIAAPHLKPSMRSSPNSRVFHMHKTGLVGMLGPDRAFASSHVQHMLASGFQMGPWANAVPSASLFDDPRGSAAGAITLHGEFRGGQGYEAMHGGHGDVPWPHTSDVHPDASDRAAAGGRGLLPVQMGTPGTKPLGPPRARSDGPLSQGGQGADGAGGGSQYRAGRPSSTVYDNVASGVGRAIMGPGRPAGGVLSGKRSEGRPAGTSDGRELELFPQEWGGAGGRGPSGGAFASRYATEFRRVGDEGGAPLDPREGPRGEYLAGAGGSKAGGSDTFGGVPGGGVGGNGGNAGWPRLKGPIASASCARPPRPPMGDRGMDRDDRKGGGHNGVRDGPDPMAGVDGQADRAALHAKYSSLLKRRLYHSRTALPMTEEDILSNVDSDDEEDEEQWLREQTLLLDEFPDLSATEKSFMLLWNTYFHKNPLYADMHCPAACKSFARHSVGVIGRSAELRRCFMLHLTNLWDLTLIDSKVIDTCLQIIDGAVPAAGS